MDSLPTEINFVDFDVKTNGAKLETNFFCKATDTHEFFHAQSYNPNVYKNLEHMIR